MSKRAHKPFTSHSIAGTHTTAATTSLLFYHLLHSPATLQQCVEEIDTNMPDLGAEDAAYSTSLAEASLPFFRDCMKENFRITPVFTMPLARRVMAPGGIELGGQHIPGGVRQPSLARVVTLLTHI